MIARSSKNRAGTTLKSMADLPAKKLVSCTRSYAARGSSQNTVTSSASLDMRAVTCSRKRWPTMPLPTTTSFMLMRLLVAK